MAKTIPTKARIMKSKIAIIGSGYMAHEYYRVLANDKSVTVVGIYSRKPEAARKIVGENKNVFIADSIESLYLNTQADGVIVAVSELAVPQIMEEVFAFNWVSLVEKPVGIDMKTAEKIAHDASQLRRISFAALNRRYYSSTLKLLHELQGAQGLRVVRINDQESLVSARNANQPKLVLENWMHANSIHLIDYFSFLCRGELIQVASERHNLSAGTFLVNSHLIFSSGDIGVYNAYWNTPSSWSVNINVGDRELELKPLETYRFRSLEEMKWTESSSSEIDIQFKPGLELMCRDFVLALAGLDSGLQTIEEALGTRRLISKIYEGIDL